MSWRNPVVTLTAVALVLSSLIATDSAEAASAAIVPTRLPYPAGGTVAVGSGVSAVNDHSQLAESVPATIVPSWRNAPPRCPGTGVVEADSISASQTVTVVTESQYLCWGISGYSTTTGKLRWRRDRHFVGRATVSGNQVVYAWQEERTSRSKLEMADASSGKIRWSISRQSMTRTDISVGSGVVVDGQYVVDAATGKPRFSLAGPWEQQGTSIVAGGRIYYSGQYGISAWTTTGRELWRYSKPAGDVALPYARGNARPALHDGVLYVRTARSTIALDAATGKLRKSLPRSDSDIAFDGRIGFFALRGSSSPENNTAPVPSTVSAVDLGTGKTLWKSLLPIGDAGFPYLLINAPVVENGLVWFTQIVDTGRPAEIVALDERTGTIASRTVDGCRDGAGNSDIVFAQHRLFASTSCGVQTYVGSATAPAPADNGLLSDRDFEAGGSEWSALGSGSAALVSTPVRSGTRSLSVSSTAAVPSLAGVQRPFLTDLPQHSWYWVGCWVRPSAPGITAALDLVETAPGTAPPAPKGGQTALAPGTWTRVAATVYTQGGDGQDVVLQVSASNLSAGSTITVDDCTALTTWP